MYHPPAVSKLTGPAARAYQADLQRRREATAARDAEEWAASGLAAPVAFVPPPVDKAAARIRLTHELHSLGRS
jgi:hypothetical protein